MTGSMFFDGWSGVLRTVVIGLCAYVGLVVVLRISGKRTLTKLNAFDLVVTVALGSTLATVLLNKDVALVEGFVAFALLTFSQYAVTWLSVRSEALRRVVKSEPTLLLYRGNCLHDAIRRERVTKDELESVTRAANGHSLNRIEAIILETDGSLSVIPRSESGEPDEALWDVIKKSREVQRAQKDGER